jgi:hypothetical protein
MEVPPFNSGDNLLLLSSGPEESAEVIARFSIVLGGVIAGKSWKGRRGALLSAPMRFDPTFSASFASGLIIRDLLLIHKMALSSSLTPPLVPDLLILPRPELVLSSFT